MSVPNQLDAAQLAELEKVFQGSRLSFQPKQIRPRLVASVEGRDKSGKTDFALSAPGPIAYFSLDRGDEGVIEKWQAVKPIAVGRYYYDPPPKRKGDMTAEAARFKSEYWDPFEDDYRRAIDSQVIRTIIVDTATEMWESLRLACFGKNQQIGQQKYGDVANPLMTHLIRLAYDRGLNLILLHHMKEVYLESTDPQGNKVSTRTGKFERAGTNRISNIVQVYVETSYTEPVYDGAGHIAKPHSFIGRIKRSRINPQLAGLTVENLDFPQLATLVLPQVPVEHWGPGRRALTGNTIEIAL